MGAATRQSVRVLLLRRLRHRMAAPMNGQGAWCLNLDGTEVAPSVPLAPDVTWVVTAYPNLIPMDLRPQPGKAVRKHYWQLFAHPNGMSWGQATFFGQVLAADVSAESEVSPNSHGPLRIEDGVTWRQMTPVLTIRNYEVGPPCHNGVRVHLLCSDEYVVILTESQGPFSLEEYCNGHAPISSTQRAEARQQWMRNDQELERRQVAQTLYDQQTPEERLRHSQLQALEKTREQMDATVRVHHQQRSLGAVE